MAKKPAKPVVQQEIDFRNSATARHLKKTDVVTVCKLIRSVNGYPSYGTYTKKEYDQGVTKEQYDAAVESDTLTKYPWVSPWDGKTTYTIVHTTPKSLHHSIVDGNYEKNNHWSPGTSLRTTDTYVVICRDHSPVTDVAARVYADFIGKPLFIIDKGEDINKLPDPETLLQRELEGIRRVLNAKGSAYKFREISRVVEAFDALPYGDPDNIIHGAHKQDKRATAQLASLIGAIDLRKLILSKLEKVASVSDDYRQAVEEIKQRCTSHPTIRQASKALKLHELLIRAVLVGKNGNDDEESSLLNYSGAISYLLAGGSGTVVDSDKAGMKLAKLLNMDLDTAMRKVADSDLLTAAFAAQALS